MQKSNTFADKFDKYEPFLAIAFFVAVAVVVAVSWWFRRPPVVAPKPNDPMTEMLERYGLHGKAVILNPPVDGPDTVSYDPLSDPVYCASTAGLLGSPLRQGPFLRLLHISPEKSP